MKYRNKMIAVLTAVLLIAGLCACGAGSNQATESAQAAEATQTADAENVSTIILRPGVDSYQAIDKGTLEVIRSILETRLEGAEIEGYSVSADADKTQITVTVPKESDTKDLRELLTVRGEVTFRAPDGEVLMDGSAVKGASAQVSTGYSDGGEAEDAENAEASYIVLLEFTDAGSKRFAEITEEYLNQEVGVYLDDEELASPRIQAVIDDGAAQIEGDFTAEESVRIANLINASALPFPLEIVDTSEKA